MTQINEKESASEKRRPLTRSADHAIDINYQPDNREGRKAGDEAQGLDCGRSRALATRFQE
ncbi:hypothetical protein [Methylobacterium sp. WCS2018Hpa-22]|uniref:hypothetical protein n=1 Tax=Methylobacterium sp. WCS2018Hpa-22 TaxID=3073633 RepID=UPI00288A15D8|nr:hypothetical protein [Methylobacterium sp. WCS2018Hpa-22]